MKPLPRAGYSSVRFWTAEEDDYLRANWETMTGAQCAVALGRASSSVYNRAKLLKLERSEQSPIGDGRWAKGVNNRPQKRRSKTKPSLDGRPSNSWLPIGTERKKQASGVIYRKVSDAGNRAIDWRPVHELIYIEHHGELKEGQYVWFVDKDKDNFAIDNLVAMTRAEAVIQNSIQRYPRELRITLQQIGRMKRVIRESQ